MQSERSRRDGLARGCGFAAAMSQSLRAGSAGTSPFHRAACECGFGRTDPSRVPRMLAGHRAAAQMLADGDNG